MIARHRNMNAHRSLVSGIAVMSVLLLSFAVVSPVLAQANANNFSQGLEQVKTFAGTNELGGAKSTKEILQSIVKWLLSLVGTLAVISLLYGGFLYITSQGEENQTEKAKMLILYSVIGLVIIGISAIIVNVVISLTQ